MISREPAISSLPQVLIDLLARRGVAAAELEGFLNPKLADLADPLTLDGVRKAAEIILSAVRERREIVIFGDYDCDGVAATAILAKTIEALGAKASTFIPRRLTEGYGMTEASVGRMLKEYPSVALVVTVDNGINSIAEVEGLRAKGIEVVITDHHLPTVEMSGALRLPAAAAIVNPKVASPSQLKELCGAAVAFFLSRAMVDASRREGLYRGENVAGPLVVLAGLATITDVMPLLGQNRILVYHALRLFNAYAPIGLKKLLERASRASAVKLSSRDFGFCLGPRINAAGRIAEGGEALELVMASDDDIAAVAAQNVDGYNNQRREIEQRMLEEALTKIVEGEEAQVIDLPGGHPGVAGIVAARVMERLDRKCPVCIVVDGHGSARAPVGYNLRDVLAQCSAQLERFGGHALAAGVSVAPGKVEAFREAFAAACRLQAAAAIAAGGETNDFDAVIEPKLLTLEFAQAVARLEPFGEGNAEPRFAFEAVELNEVRNFGAEGRHLSVTVGGVRGVWWNHGHLVEQLRAQASLPRQVIFAVERSEFGSPHVEMRILAIRP